MTIYYIGTAGWTYEDWKGRFYPKNLAKSHWLEYYTQKFNVLEINATFYRLFANSTYLKWYERAADDFKYVLKAPKIITHQHRLENVTNDIISFEQSAHLLQEKLGLILLQLPPSLEYAYQKIECALSSFSDPSKVVIEFRDEKWFTAEIKEILQKYNAVFCAADSPIIKLQSWTTSDTAYIRLHGSEKWFDYNYSQEELKNIAEFAKGLSNQGAQRIYIIFNNTVKAYAILNALTLRELLS